MVIHPKDWAYSTWEAWYGRKPLWGTVKKEWVHLSRAVKQVSEPRFKAAWYAYLRCDEEFFKGHRPSLFAQNLDRFLEEGRTASRIPESTEVAVSMSRQVALARELREADVAAGRPALEWRHYTGKAAKEMGILK